MSSITPDSVVSPSITQTTVPGGWTEKEVVIEGRTFRLVLPADPDAFLDDLALQPVEVQNSADVYWSMLWQAAPVMASRVLKRKWTSGMKMLEFGCGIGLVGLAAASAGLHVTFSDYEEMAVKTALENARRNELTNVAGAVLDWREPPKEKYPLVFGCDVLYNREMHEALIGFLDAVMTDDGLCWIGDAGRFHAGAFLQLANTRGFTTRIEDEEGNEMLRPHHGKYQMFVLRRKR